MDAPGLDRIARHLARSNSRRLTLQASALGLAVAMARHVGLGAPVGQGGHTGQRGVPRAAQSTPAACPAGSERALALDGAWLCRQPYALCTTAPCKRSASDPAIASCRCVVLDGYSMGYTTCGERVLSGRKLVSTFSTQNVTSAFGALSCPEDAPWANCLDMPCELDPLDPALATCQCQVVETGPSFTFGGACDAQTCTSVIWSGAAPPGVTQYAAAMACVDQPVTFPGACPAATPVPAPGATPVSA
jgi:hypothetical protein